MTRTGLYQWHGGRVGAYGKCAKFLFTGRVVDGLYEAYMDNFVTYLPGIFMPVMLDIGSMGGKWKRVPKEAP